MLITREWSGNPKCVEQFRHGTRNVFEVMGLKEGHKTSESTKCALNDKRVVM